MIKQQSFFEKLGGFICKKPYMVLGFLIIFEIIIGVHISKLTIDTSNESFFHEDDPTLIKYHQFRDLFGRDEKIIIAIESDRIFDFSFLEQLKNLHRELEQQVPYIKTITSLINARNTRGDNDDNLIVDDLLKKWPQNKNDLIQLKKYVLNHPLYRNRLISEDGRFTTIIIETDNHSSPGGQVDNLSFFDDDLSQQKKPPYITNEEDILIVEAVKSVVSKYEDRFKIYIAGSSVVMDTFKRSMKQDMKTFMRLAIITIGFCLFIMFRRLSGVIIPLFVVAMSLIATFGIMAIIGVKFKMPSMILPSFLLAVGVGGCVHLLTMFYQNYQKTGDKTSSIINALKHSGFPIVMTGITTITGLISFSTAKVAPIADLGIYSCIGVLMVLIYTLVLLPALIAVLNLKKTLRPVSSKSFFDRILISISNFSIKYARRIIIVCFCLIIVGLMGVQQLIFSHNVLSWLSDSKDIKRSTQKIDKELKGSVTLEVLLDTGKENGLYDPVVLKKLDTVATQIEQIKHGSLFVGKILNIADVIKEINQALHKNNVEYYTIPDRKKLISQEFLLFENSGSDDLEDFVDSQFRIARFTIKVPWSDALEYVAFVKKIQNIFHETFFESGSEITVTGMMSLFAATFDASIHSAAASYVVAGIIVSFMMVVMLRSFKIGLLCMLPNFFPIITVLGIMGWAGYSLNMFTMLVGSIALGLAVDDTIHFMYHFIRYYREFGTVQQAVYNTFNTAGRAMLVSSIVLSLGFFIFMFSSMKNIFTFGLLTGIIVILALLADFIIAPALMMQINHNNCSTKNK
jgi:hypothetical protein